MLEFDYARNALRYIIKEFGIKQIYIPYYLCDVMRHAVFAEGCKTLFYHIDDNFMPSCKFPKTEYIIYSNYFGICDKNVEKLAEIYPKLIVDNAHAYYAKPQGFASFNSARKFLPVKSGAYLYYGSTENTQKPDYERRKRFDKLHEKYSMINQLRISLEPDSIPFCYPLLCPTIEEADEYAKKFTKEGKTIYRYWNSLPESYNEYKFYSRLVPVPLDFSSEQSL